nr:hypothetical protein [Tanacetum cinerariifolium]
IQVAQKKFNIAFENADSSSRVELIPFKDQYALMVNPTIYALCIKQLWASVSIKKTNDVVKLQALIDRKNMAVTEDTIQQDLRLDDVDGVECLPTEEIFAESARMGYEKPPPKTAWNEFSSSMASAVICLATGVETSLFDIMLVQPQDDVENEDDNEVPAAPTPPSPTPVTTPKSPTHEPSPPPQEPISSPPQEQPTQPTHEPSPPPQEPLNLIFTIFSKNLFPPLDNPELTIRRRSHTDPTLLNNSEMAAEGNGDLPVPDLRTMEELCQPSLNGQGGPIASIAIQETNLDLGMT